MSFSDLYVRLIEDIDYIEIIDFITKQLKPSDVILDAGCGSGVILSPLIQKGFDVTGIDIDEEMLSYAQKALGHQGKLFIHDLREPLGLTFDVILMFNDVINYFKGAKTVLMNLKRALKPGGMLLFDFYKVDYLTEMDGYVESENNPVVYTWKTKTSHNKLIHQIETEQEDYQVIQYVYEPGYYIGILKSLGLKVTILEGPDERKLYIKATK
ncbi:class I SAM-dependent methyltransferase [Acholeplasma vituli]|uniref:Class I SAM-dependent methyltransferase n=1 Tax=Paracholeplasma vituli TaxID=69473 RepID=A0ABT2PY41_9MOLU|nr:class I SAM-dependent methyltransferase [Paracholeplasma vituli]MCU0105391.1 class I SAM-dependent methyltransferase [Paracholeplasma vituli]